MLLQKKLIKKTMRCLVLAAFFALLTPHCYAEIMLVSEPVAHVWVHQKTYAGPYKYPLTLGRGAIPLFTHAFYGELLFVKKNMTDFAMVALPGQLCTFKGSEDILPLVGYVQPQQIQQASPAWLALQPLVVVIPSLCVKKTPCEQGDVLITVPFGSMLRATGVPVDRQEWQEIMLVDGQQGYVPTSAVKYYDQSLPVLSELRETVCVRKDLFIGQPYCFGGRSIFTASYLSGADCSGLTHLLYHAAGLFIPRLAHAQFLAAQPIDPMAMQPGDLIFFKRKKKKYLTVTHMAMYLGDGKVLEAPGLLSSPLKVHMIAIKDYFGVPLEKLYQGCEVMQYNDRAHSKLYFGSFLATPEAALEARKKFLALQRGDFSALVPA